MKRLFIAIGILLAIYLCIDAASTAIKLARDDRDRELAVTVLRDCYCFVFAREIDSRALVTPFTIPKTLNELPGWTEHIEKTVDPALRPLYLRINWHPPKNPEEGKEIASIDFPNSRAILLQGGMAFSKKK